jgi:CubicO group peptidase (beta-lactamase class C family)
MAWVFPAILVVVGTSPSCRHADDALSIAEQVDRLLAPLVAEDLVSGSVLLARGDEVLAKGYGLASREHNVPNCPKTRFLLGSLTKSITAVAIMQLQESGRLQVGDPIIKYLPDYPGGDRITIHHLLTHTSGIKNYHSLPGCVEKSTLPLSTAEKVAWIQAEPLQWEPGTRFEYSNSNYMLLTRIIERVSGKSYEGFLQDRVFGPAHMRDSGVGAHRRIVVNSASGYSRDQSGKPARPPHYRDPSFDAGSGSVYSTVFDLLSFAKALRSDKFLSEDSVKQMFSVHARDDREGDYGYGWFVAEEFGRKVVYHDGGTGGFMTILKYFVDEDVVVIALLNQDFIIADELFDRLSAIALGEPWGPLFAPMSPETLRTGLGACTGEYAMEGGGRLKLTLEDGTLCLQEEGAAKFMVYPLSGRRGYVKEQNARLVFREPEGDGPMEIITLYGNLLWRGKRVPQ